MHEAGWRCVLVVSVSSGMSKVALIFDVEERLLGSVVGRKQQPWPDDAAYHSALINAEHRHMTMRIGVTAALSAA